MTMRVMTDVHAVPMAEVRGVTVEVKTVGAVKESHGALCST